MKEILGLMPMVLYLLIGAISLVMAFKNLFSTKFLPFHEKAAGKLWSEIDNPLKLVILSLLRLAGLGFLTVSILMIVCAIVNYFAPNVFCKYLVPVVALMYCIGLFVINYSLYKNTKADTPWKGSLYAMSVIIAGIIISIFNQIIVGS
jgi:ABC-type multidrug transport system fused ATPase/permease subunit